MDSRSLDALEKALELIHTPLALEVLDALARDVDPYACGAQAAVDAAIRYLRDLGALTTSPRALERRGQLATLTQPGRTLHRSLVEIEQGSRLPNTTPLGLVQTS